ncbi:MAG: hypothetical protein ABIO65_03200 [Nitrospiria bacterium]
MGVHRITSPAAKAYMTRERILNDGMSLLGTAAEKTGLSQQTLEAAGDLAAQLVPHAPGYGGKALQILATQFWRQAKVKDKSVDMLSFEDLEEKVEALRRLVG